MRFGGEIFCKRFLMESDRFPVHADSMSTVEVRGFSTLANKLPWKVGHRGLFPFSCPPSLPTHRDGPPLVSSASHPHLKIEKWGTQILGLFLSSELTRSRFRCVWDSLCFPASFPTLSATTRVLRRFAGCFRQGRGKWRCSNFRPARRGGGVRRSLPRGRLFSPRRHGCP